jgi:hypothetical protein
VNLFTFTVLFSFFYRTLSENAYVRGGASIIVVSIERGDIGISLIIGPEGYAFSSKEYLGSISRNNDAERRGSYGRRGSNGMSHDLQP